MTAAPLAGVPVQLTRFVGRTRELAELAGVLGRARLLTLTGAGGSGKTRLAAEAVGRAADGREVVWVELGSLTDPARVGERLAAAVGLRDAWASDERLAEALRGRPVIVVLDNCEHLLDGCAPLVAALLRSLPDLTIVATSRESLGVPGETAWHVPPLAVPEAARSATAAALAGVDAVQLFAERAQAAYPIFRLTDENASSIAQICRRLDGIPLALELAAARVRVLSPEQLARRLDDVFHLLGAGGRGALPRHRTLRAAIDWSYDLLSPEERWLFERLSVFAGSFRLEAAESVGAGEGLEATDVLDRLAALVDKSLLGMREEGETARYRMLEAVRQYARDRLRERGEEEVVLERHARWCLADVTAAQPALSIYSPRELLQIDAEHDDCRAALAWGLANGRADDLALPLAGALAWYWYYRAYWDEGLRWLELALEAAAPAPTAARAAALRIAGAFANFRGDAPRARARLEASEVIWRTLGDERQLILTLSNLGQVLVELGEIDAARERAAEALERARRLGDEVALAYALINAPVTLALVAGDRGEAERHFEEAEALYRRGNLRTWISLVTGWRAQLALWRDDPASAERLARGTLAVSVPLRLDWNIARSLRVLGHLAHARGAPEQAARLLGAAERVLRQLGARILSVERGPHEEEVARLRARLGEQALAALFAEGAAMPIEALVGPIVEEAGGETGQPPAPALREEAAPDLRVRALGPLRVDRAGEEVAREAWGSSKTRELLLFLLLHPDGLTREQVGLAFWPDASSAQVRNNFHVTLHRLRKALGEVGWVVAEEGRYRIAPAVRCEVDAVRFERDVGAALRLPPRSPQRRALLAGALPLYAGDLLEHEPVGDWHLPFRDRLRRLYRDGALAYATDLAEAGEPAAAIAVYRALIVREPLDEEATRGCMRVLARMGDRAEALRLHRRLVVLLETELEAAPDPGTAELADRIQAGEPV